METPTEGQEDAQIEDNTQMEMQFEEEELPLNKAFLSKDYDTFK
jgi:hypothetical protein